MIKLTVTFKSENTVKCLFSVYYMYAPTQDYQFYQNNFSNKINEELTPFANESILLWGDFNFYMQPKLDKMDSMSNRYDNFIYSKDMHALLECMNLTNCFRDLHPKLRSYTSHSMDKSSRLDYWFISEHLLNELES